MGKMPEEDLGARFYVRDLDEIPPSFGWSLIKSDTCSFSVVPWYTWRYGHCYSWQGSGRWAKFNFERMLGNNSWSMGRLRTYVHWAHNNDEAFIVNLVSLWIWMPSLRCRVSGFETLGLFRCHPGFHVSCLEFVSPCQVTGSLQLWNLEEHAGYIWLAWWWRVFAGKSRIFCYSNWTKCRMHSVVVVKIFSITWELEAYLTGETAWNSLVKREPQNLSGLWMLRVPPYKCPFQWTGAFP